MRSDYILSLGAEYIEASRRLNWDDIYDLRVTDGPLRISPELRAECIKLTAEALRDLGEDAGYMTDGTLVRASDG